MKNEILSSSSSSSSLVSSSEAEDEEESKDQNDSEDDPFGQPRFDVDEISEFVHDHGLSSTVVEYEQVITLCGYGWFHRILLLVCGWAFISDSIEIQVNFHILLTITDNCNNNSLRSQTVLIIK